MPSRIAQFLPKEIEEVRRAKEGAEPAPHAGKLPVAKGRVRQRVADLCGVGRRTVDKIAEIYAELERDPAAMGPIVDDLNRTGKVNGAHRRMRRLLDERRVLGLAPVPGRFSTLVLDPPWQDETVSESQRPPYATMTVEAIRDVPVADWQLDRGHIYCHAPGPWLSVAIPLIEHWGYAYKTVLTWQKSRWSMGRYFRTEDEYVVFGTRGGLMTRRQDLSNHFAGPVGIHSAKPDAFYELVRTTSYPPFGEAFQRQAREGFEDLYGPAPALEAAE